MRFTGKGSEAVFEYGHWGERGRRHEFGPVIGTAVTEARVRDVDATESRPGDARSGVTGLDARCPG